jgi:hypothetical protein
MMGQIFISELIIQAGLKTLLDQAKLVSFGN